ncbi:hypothetical protein [Ascidiimonas sp. W6]|uniref:hypothetical protein n=1 Tax=Ascidiimonas meishanensis TaxID=3128903 RepID=UPI0030ECBD98
MKKIKKWQIVILILIIVGGYWLFENTWIIEPKIEVNGYRNTLKDSSWSTEKRDSIWTFNSNQTFTEKPIKPIPYRESRKKWEIDDSSLLIDDEEIGGDSLWHIHTITNKTMVLELVSPSVNSKYVLQLKKI